MFDVIFSGTNEEQVEKAEFFEIGLNHRTKEEAASFADAVAGGNDAAAEARLRDIVSLKATHAAFGADSRLAALNEWVERDNAKRSKERLVRAVTDQLLSHIR
jgi:hypothetical protein